MGTEHPCGQSCESHTMHEEGKSRAPVRLEQRMKVKQLGEEALGRTQQLLVMLTSPPLPPIPIVPATAGPPGPPTEKGTYEKAR
jgi:hypothetical protein